MAVASSSNLALLTAVFIATCYFLQLFYQDLQRLPEFNLVRLIGVGTGLFYFGGAAARVAAATLWPENPFLRYSAVWRDYSVPAMVSASVLVLLCSGSAIFLSYLYKPRHLWRLHTIDSFAEEVERGQRSEFTKSLLLLAVFGGMAGYLLWTGQLAVNVAPTQAFGGGVNILAQWSVFLNWAALACIYPFMTLILDRRSTPLVRTVIAALAIPLWITVFIFGRRYFVSALLVCLIVWLVYTRRRLNMSQWLVALAVAVVAFFLTSSVFLKVRSSQGAQQSTVQMKDALSARTAAYAIKMGPEDIAALSATRADILGELAMFVVRFPPDHIHLGGGVVSQSLSIIPAQFWPGKRAFMAEGFYGDDKLCVDAGLPPEDMASSLVLYSFAEFWWFAPLMFGAVAVGFVYLSDVIVGWTKSYAVYAVAVPTIVGYAIMADASYEVAVFSDLRSLLVVGVVMGAARLLTPSSAPSRTGLALARPRP